MKRKGFLTSAAIGAATVVIAGGGGYWAAASAQPGAVNAPTGVAPAGAPTSFADIVQRVAPAVVSIDVEGKARPSATAFPSGTPFFQFGVPGQDDGQDSPFGFDFRKMFPQMPNAGDAQPMRASGSGFFISADGYIVTNNHVVEGADKITVRTKDDRELPARLIGRDPATDLAVVKVDGTDFPFVTFEDRARPRVGDWVVAVGNPFGLGGTATAGIVSALQRRDVGESNYVDFMQIDAPINRGNSGGPTFDLYGRVVGVNTAIYSPSGGSVGIGFDIPADVAASVSRQLIASGKVTRGYIGASIQSVTPEIADSLGMAGPKGALVAELTPGGPAEGAGLQPGDVVLKLDGHDLRSADDLVRQVGLTHPGEMLRLEVRRGREVLNVEVRAGLRPSEAQLASGEDNNNGSGPSADVLQVLGMSLQPHPGGGVAIERVHSGSAASEKGLQSGDVILRAGERRTTTAADVSSAVAEARRAGRKDVLLLVAHDGRHLFVPLEIDKSEG